MIRLGENGLTRDIVFNRRAALAWIASSGLFPEGTVFGNYDSFICGLLNEDANEPAEQAAPPEPEPEEEEPEPEEPEQEEPDETPLDEGPRIPEPT